MTFECQNDSIGKQTQKKTGDTLKHQLRSLRSCWDYIYIMLGYCQLILLAVFLEQHSRALIPPATQATNPAVCGTLRMRTAISLGQ